MKQNAAPTKRLISSHIVANYTEALRDLTAVTTGTWTEQHHDAQGSRRKEDSHQFRNFVNLFDIHNLFKKLQSVKQATGDAGMLIMKEALIKAEEFDNVVVHLRDTDIFVAFLHLDDDIHKTVVLETKKGCVSISERAEQLDSEMHECLPFAHAVSGCDTVSTTYGLNSWRDIMHIVGDDDVNRDYMI